MINAPADKVFTFFKNIENNYLKWHPDHVSFKWIKGEGLETGNVFYFEEQIGGILMKKEVVYTKIIPDKYIEIKLTNKFYRLILPKMTFIIESKGRACQFTQQVFIRTGPLGRWLNRREFAAVGQHQKEECENLKSKVENS